MLVDFVQSDANARLKEKIRFRATRNVEKILFLARCPLRGKWSSLQSYWLKQKKLQNLIFSKIFMDNYFDDVSDDVFTNFSDDNIFVNFIDFFLEKILWFSKLFLLSELWIEVPLILFTAMKILERLGLQTLSLHCLSKFDRSVFVNLKPISYLFGVLYGLFFDLETIGVS